MSLPSMHRCTVRAPPHPRVLKRNPEANASLLCYLSEAILWWPSPIPYCPVPKGHIASDSWGGHARGLERLSGFSLMTWFCSFWVVKTATPPPPHPAPPQAEHPCGRKWSSVVLRGSFIFCLALPALCRVIVRTLPCSSAVVVQRWEKGISSALHWSLNCHRCNQ